MRLSVLLFNAGTENEGIYTLSVNGQNTVLAFEEEDDATRYALQLEAQDFLSASVEAIDRRELEAFCESAQLKLSVITQGMFALPPQTNLEQLDWTPGRPQPTEQPSEMDLLRQRLEKLL
ncbi:DUF3110 domain-containing protein [Candidatus Cyanaurora vandensis]|uniref:DUF3110 domain-containing protein n=1 Tax=Candidatus Cyanaurora vandensis TaxID=2714958 RepID=UPI00257FEE9E|nr:DUF3110 domain-containing protein [Candidatus Cyanaurora vandensis]